MANYEIPEVIFRALVRSYCLDDHSHDAEIQKWLEEKLENIVKRQYYTTYKTAPTDLEREDARKKYLNMIQMQEDFRWTSDR